MAKKTQKDLLNDLYTNNQLTEDDVFSNRQFKIITRSGIEKIQYNNGIHVKFEPIHMDIDLIVIKAIATKDNEDRTIETFGEWNNSHAKHTQGGRLIPFYSVALAEKRALSRAVLKLMNLYEHGFKGEDEEFFKREPGDRDAESAQISYIEDLLRTCTYDHEQVAQLEKHLHELSFGEASKLIQELKENQQEESGPIKEGGRKLPFEIN